MIDVDRALALLRRCSTPAGFVAATEDRANYRRVWARDGCVCGLAALVSGDTRLVDTFEATLRTLARHQGRAGQLPSNVAHDGRVSYGGNAGRVDATLWFVLGVRLLGHRRPGVARELAEHVERAAAVLEAWEMNQRGLLYVPRAGDWADEYVLSGYVLYDQALRLWAQGGDALRQRIERSYWPGAGGPDDALYDPVVLGPLARADRSYFLAAFQPGEACDRFDALGNALCCLLGVGSDAQRGRILAHAEAAMRWDLVPAFDPPIQVGEAEYRVLEGAAQAHLRNTPGRYHNGGLWPMVNGFWVLAARAHSDERLAARLRRGIARAVALGDHAYAEYVDANTGEPGGTLGQAWSAAGAVLAAYEGSVEAWTLSG